MNYILQTNSLTKKYKNFQALNGLTMNVPKGSIYGFVGKNGAGKTTLIRLICGLQEPTSGNFSLYGIRNDSKDIIKSRRRMGAVVETPSIYMDMTAEENLKQQYLILGLPSYEGIPELLKLVGLENTGKKKAKNFSLGMKQRLGIAIALAGDPDFLVLDEPVNGLDPQGIVEMRELILKLNRERQITVLISSHILDELSRFEMESLTLLFSSYIKYLIRTGQEEDKTFSTLREMLDSSDPYTTMEEADTVEEMIRSTIRHMPIKPDYYGEYLMYKATCENRPKVLESAKRILVAIDVNFDVFGMRKEKETTDRAEHV